jgi:pimeloyl-ACP methyl ester carboxylesterase
VKLCGCLIQAAVALAVACAAPASLSARQVQEIELPYGGVILLGDLVVPDGAGLDEGVVLLTHGTLAHKDMELIESLQIALADRGVASLAPTLSHGLDRRRGMYDCAVPHRYLYLDALGEIGAWASWLAGQGAEAITLMGHSRGGNQTAWYAAERADERLSKVVLLAPATQAGPEYEAKAYKQRYGAALAPLLEEAEKLVAAGKGDRLISVPGFIYCENAEVSAAGFVSNYAPELRRDTPELIPAIEAPVLVIAGSLDKVVPDVPARIKPLADGTRVRLEVIEDADHFFLDFYAEDVADLVSELISE